jgi:hypothetical protein
VRDGVWLGVRFPEADAWEPKREGPFVVIADDHPTLTEGVRDRAWSIDGWAWLDAFSSSESLGPEYRSHLMSRISDLSFGEFEDLAKLVYLPGPDRPASTATELVRPFVERAVTGTLDRV